MLKSPDTNPSVPPNPTDEPTLPTEILSQENYGISARLLFATQPDQDAASILNPDNKGIDVSKFSLPTDRNYNPLFQGLSTRERLDAWTGVDFNVAKERWKATLTRSINSTADTNKDRLDAIQLISGKKAADFKIEDAETLYISFCNGMSDITAFERSIIEKLKAKSADGKTVDPLELKRLMQGIQWFARSFFGKQTSLGVSPVIELEAELNNDAPKILKTLFDPATSKINNLTPEEENILRPVSTYFEEPVKGAPLEEDEESKPAAAAPPAAGTTPASATGSASATSPDQSKQRIFNIKEAIKALERGDRNVTNPVTGLSLSTMGRNEALYILEQQLEKEKAITIAEPTMNDTFKNQLNFGLKESHELGSVTFNLSNPKIIEGVLTSLLGDRLSGSVAVEFEEGKGIQAKGVRIKRSLGFPEATYDFTFASMRDKPGNIEARISRQPRTFFGKGDIKKILKQLDPALENALKDNLDMANSADWRLGDIDVDGRNVSVRFFKSGTIATQTNTPSQSS